MLLIFKAWRHYRYHNDDIVLELNNGIPAVDGDIIDVTPESHAKYLIKEFPNSWFDYKMYKKTLEVSAQREMKRVEEKVKREVDKAPHKMVSESKPKKQRKKL